MSESKVLIDSPVLIWLLYEPEKISVKAKELIQAADVVYVSAVSLWELTLKFGKGKLACSPAELVQGVGVLNLDRLPLRDEHMLTVLDIQLAHKDPFDALLVAQSESEGCIFLTADSHILESKYQTVQC